MGNTMVEINNYLDALTIEERVEIYKKYVFCSLDYMPYQEWISVRGVVKEEDIDLMLKVRNISKEDFNLALKELSFDERTRINSEMQNMEWMTQFNKILTTYEKKNNHSIDDIKILDLSLSVSPFILWTNLELKKSITELKNIEIDQEVIVGMLNKLTSCLLSHSIKTLVWELHLYQQGKNNIKESTDTDRNFKDFVKDSFIEVKDLVRFYNKYPVLARILTIKTQEILNHYQEFLVRLDDNFLEVCEKLSLDKSKNKIMSINCDQGDTHQQGRFVIRTNLEDDVIIYKPRNLQIQEKFFKFVEYVNNESNLLDIRINEAFYKDNYTFEKFVVYKPCETEEEVINYYKRFGQICMLIHVLSGNDIHYENLIASGEYPVIIDVETLFQHQSSIINLSENAFNNAYRECIDSIAGTALVPIIAFNQGANKRGVDISALNGDEQVLPDKVLTLVDSNQDTMRFDYKEIKIHGANNIPTLNGEKISFFKYITYIIEGFKNGLEFIMQHKEDITRENGILTIFKGTTVRHLLKATQNYARLMSFASHPNYTTNIIKLERMFTNAWAYNYRDKRAVKCEVEDMLGGDIPIFYGIVDSTNIISSRGEVISNYFEKSAYDKVVDKIKNLSNEAIQKQIAQIEISLGMYREISNERFKKRKENSVDVIHMDAFKGDRSKLLEEAERIANQIIAEMIVEPHSDTITWNNTVYDYINECWKVRPLDNGLLYGMAGICTFFYTLNKYVKNESYQKVFLKTLQSLLEIISEEVDLNAYSGLSAALYPLTRMYKDTKDAKIYNHIYKIARIIDRKFTNISSNDLMTGHAGIIKALVNSYNVTQEEMYISVAQKSVNKICEDLDLNNVSQLEIGMANGLAGIYSALRAFNKVKPTEEVQVLCSKIQSIQGDLIGAVKDYSWSNGLLGIVLSELKDGNTLDDEIVEQTISHIKVHSKIEDSLFEGTMGDIELLQTYYEKTNDKLVLESINDKVAELISRRKVNGDYNYYTIEGYTSVGLAYGLSGIGYELLRLYDHKHVPNVLNLEIEQEG